MSPTPAPSLCTGQLVRFGRTGFAVSRLAFGCVSLGVVDPATGWNPFSADGEALVQRLIHAALAAGINLFDVSPDYGAGQAERLLGRALRARPGQALIASKVDYGGKTPADVRASVLASLDRLGVEALDLIQFHGGNYPPSSVKRIVDGGLLDALEALRAEGRVHAIGLTVADPITAKALIETGRFDTVQLNYSLIEQAASRHALEWAAARDMGVTVMRPLGAGLLDRLLPAIAPEWLAACAPAEVCLRFLLADSRVHTIKVGMRSEAEIAANVAVVESFRPTVDVAALPRSVGAAARGGPALPRPEPEPGSGPEPADLPSSPVHLQRVKPPGEFS